MTSLALGVDIGGTKILTGLVAADGTVSNRHQLTTPAHEGSDAIIATVLSAARVTLKGTPDVVRCGVGTAGVVNAQGAIASATDLLRGWSGTELRALLTDQLQMSVTVLNDVHAAAVCEARLGAARMSGSALVLAVGTGIGGAIVHNGAPLAGQHGIAGSIGHMPSPVREGRICSCGATDHIEAYASGPALEREYLRRTGQSHDLRTMAAADDPVAATVIAEGAEALGCVIGGANNLLDAAIIVIGGGVAALGDIFFDPLRKAALRESLGATSLAPIVPAQFGPEACLIGAALSA